MPKNSLVRANVVTVLSVGLLLGLSGVAQADDGADRWDDAYSKGAWDPADYPDCGEALGKFYVSGAAGALGGPAGVVAGAATGLPDVYLDCPTVEAWQQNGT